MPIRGNRTGSRKSGPPYDVPCTFPLHHRTPGEPLWIRMDFKEAAWCTTCEGRQKHYLERSRVPPGSRSAWFDSKPRPRGLRLSSKGAIQRRLSELAIRTAPEGQFWCTWGCHYDDLEHQTSYRESICQFCKAKGNKIAKKKYDRTSLFRTKAQLKRAVVALREERAELLSKIKEEKDELRRLKAAISFDGIEPSWDDYEIHDVAGDPLVLPKPPTPKRRKRDIARSYT